MKGIRNQKPTDFMVNNERMARKLSKRCQGGHQYQPLIGGIARLAQKYPKKLCEAMSKGAEEEFQHRSQEKLWAIEGENTQENGKNIEEMLEDAMEEENLYRAVIPEEGRDGNKESEEKAMKEVALTGGLNKNDKAII